MRESQIISHRVVDCEDNVSFTMEDGIDALGGRAAIPTCLNCNHLELTMEEKEAVDPLMCESHRNHQSSTHLLNHSWDSI